MKIFVPDPLQDEEESNAFFDATLEDLAIAVESRLRRRRPDWPIETLVQQIRHLKPSA